MTIKSPFTSGARVERRVFSLNPVAQRQDVNVAMFVFFQSVTINYVNTDT